MVQYDTSKFGTSGSFQEPLKIKLIFQECFNITRCFHTLFEFHITKQHFSKDRSSWFNQPALKGATFHAERAK